MQLRRCDECKAESGGKELSYWWFTVSSGSGGSNSEFCSYKCVATWAKRRGDQEKQNERDEAERLAAKVAAKGEK